MLLLCLPPVAFASICSDWIDVIDVAKLDTASTTHTKRNLVLDRLSSKYIKYNDVGKAYKSSAYFAWLGLRGVHVSCLFLNDNNAIEYILGSFENWRCERIDSLTVPACNTLGLSSLYASFINSCINLTSLAIASSPFTIPEIGITTEMNFIKCPHLKNLRLTQFDTTHPFIVQLLDNCSTLESIFLDDCGNVDRELIESLDQHCPNIHKIELVNFQFSLRLFDQQFSKLSSFSLIDSNEAEIKVEDIKTVVEQHPALTELHLVNCYVNEIVLDAISSHCTLLRVLNLEKCAYVTDTALVKVFSKCQSIKTVNISYTSVTRAAILSVLQYCPLVETIIAAHCNGRSSNVPNDSIPLAHCKALLSVDFRYSSIVTDYVLGSVALAAPNLLVVIASNCMKLTGLSIKFAAEKCVKLRELYLGNCKEVGSGAVTSLDAHCPHLRILDIMYCSKIKESAVVDKLKGCTVFGPGWNKSYGSNYDDLFA